MREWLVAEGWAADDVFLDLHGIGAGARWKEALAKANERCEAVLFLISPHALASNECYVELRMAEDMGKVIVPAILPARVPEDRLSIDDQRLALHRDRQIVDASIEPREAAFTVEHEGQRRTVAFHAPTLARIKARLEHLGISPDSFAWTPANLETATPYPGLAGFHESEAALFFGRAGDIARGFASLRKLRRAAINGGQGALLVIQAASGAGKSSFLKAGLWPRLARDPDFTPIAILRPATGILTGDTGVGRQVSAFLARYNRQRPATEIHRALRGTDAEAQAAFAGLIGEATQIGRDTQRLANPDAPPPMPVIAVDQAEELFAADDAAESRRFLAMLAGLMGTGSGTGDTPATRLSPPPLFVWTVRADSMDTLLHATTQHGLGAPELFPLPPIPRTSFGEIINGPLTVANRSGMRLAIDPLLTQKLIEVSDGADALPLLAYTLRQLVEDNRAGARAQISLEAFETGGGIGGVLRKRLVAAQRKAGADDARLRALFVPRLATWDGDARPPAAKRMVADEAELFAGERAGLKDLADALVEERLLTRGGGEGERTTLEVAHEALLRQPPLAQWLEEAREFLVWRDGLGRARRGFEANTRPHLMGRELEIARGWLQGAGGGDIPSEDRAFIEASLAAEERVRSEAAERERKRQQAELEAAKAREQAAQEAAKAAQERAIAARRVARRTAAGLFVAVLLAGISGWLGFQSWQRGEALVQQVERADKQAEVAKQQTVVAQQQRDVAEKQTIVAKQESERAQRQSELAARRAEETARLRRETQITESGRLAQAANALFDIVQGRDAVTVLLLSLEGLPDRALGIEREVVPETGRIAEQALDAARERRVLAGHKGPVVMAVFSPDGTRIVTASGDRTARLWEAATGRLLATLQGHEGWVQSAVFSPDGARIVTASDDNTARVWEAATGRLLATLQGHTGTVWRAGFSPQPAAGGVDLILTASDDKTARLWRVPSTVDALVKAAKDRAPRCLTQAQRKQYFLPPTPPLWCAERRLWPYQGDDWQTWLTQRKTWLANPAASEPALPKVE